MPRLEHKGKLKTEASRRWVRRQGLAFFLYFVPSKGSSSSTLEHVTRMETGWSGSSCCRAYADGNCRWPRMEVAVACLGTGPFPLERRWASQARQILASEIMMKSIDTIEELVLFFHEKSLTWALFRWKFKQCSQVHSKFHVKTLNAFTPKIPQRNHCSPFPSPGKRHKIHHFKVK